MALHDALDDIRFAFAVYAALLLGLAVTALGHVAVAPADQFGRTGAHQWTSVYSVNNVAPLVAAATGFDAGRRNGRRAAVGGFVGVAAGYALVFLGTYAVNAVALNAAQANPISGGLAAGAVGVGTTAALFAGVGAHWQ